MTDIKKIRASTRSVYDRQAKAWQKGRKSHKGERQWLKRLLEGLSEGSEVLDLGCGTGHPFAREILSSGHRLTGIDFSAEMIAIARNEFPSAQWRVAHIEDFDEPRKFDAIFSWDGFFHLTPEQQRSTLPRMVQGLRPEGRLMLTIGDTFGEVTGQVFGEPVYHSSLSPREYKENLSALGMRQISITTDDPSTDRIVLFAMK